MQKASYITGAWLARCLAPHHWSTAFAPPSLPPRAVASGAVATAGMTAAPLAEGTGGDMADTRAEVAGMMPDTTGATAVAVGAGASTSPHACHPGMHMPCIVLSLCTVHHLLPFFRSAGPTLHVCAVCAHGQQVSSRVRRGGVWLRGAEAQRRRVSRAPHPPLLPIHTRSPPQCAQSYNVHLLCQIGGAARPSPPV
jgi:hypothetical protein